MKKTLISLFIFLSLMSASSGAFAEGRTATATFAYG